MRTSILVKVWGPGLAALLVLVPVAPAGAGAAGQGFDLGLEQALDRELAVDLAAAAEEPAGPEAASIEEVTPPIRLASVRDAAWQSTRNQQQQQATQSSPQPKKRGFGRWLKRHWWVPVLVGAAIGVAVSDDGSDSPDDPEDDD